ncbi:hypothetical protein E2542_SST17683 [Spatholobus suberectus]|nr:hypothetical protein E2542_SST17683 [Spatholobus suberectus]
MVDDEVVGGCWMVLINFEMSANSSVGTIMVAHRILWPVNGFVVEVVHVSGFAAMALSVSGFAMVSVHGGAITPYATCAPIGRWAKVHGNIETVDEGDVEEVQIVELVERVFREGVGWGTVCLALEETPTVTGLAMTAARTVEATSGSGPNAGSFGSCCHVEGPGLARV